MFHAMSSNEDTVEYLRIWDLFTLQAYGKQLWLNGLKNNDVLLLVCGILFLHKTAGLYEWL